VLQNISAEWGGGRGVRNERFVEVVFFGWKKGTFWGWRYLIVDGNDFLPALKLR